MSDIATPRSRRALLASAAGGALAATVGSLARPEAVAAVDTPLLLNAPNQATAPTSLSVNLPDGASSPTAFLLTTESAEFQGVTGISAIVTGLGGSIGVAAEAHGESAFGVWGRATNTGGAPAIGVYGTADENGYGVRGSAWVGVVGEGETGTGVRGETETGTALHGTVTQPATGFGLDVEGRVRFSDRAKGAVVKAGKSSVKVTVPGARASHVAVATLNQNRSGRYVRAAVCSADAVTIYLNRAVDKDTRVGWVLLG